MNITIKERKFSFTAEYDIEVPSVRYYARKAYFSLTDKLKLQCEDGRQLARIHGFISPFRHRHEIYLSDGRMYRFKCEKIWRRVFTCGGNQDFYRLYEHKGLRYSIFHNDRQVAAFKKNRVVFLKGYRYEISMDQDADLILILCLVLTLNSSEQSDNDDATITFDLGNLLEDRPYDASWQPR
ncbi:MAG: hypothetical protein P4L03_05280 [Terracidiphilus sp.]|nr:hypothetical protein [Terracidiphilus sp.]